MCDGMERNVDQMLFQACNSGDFDVAVTAIRMGANVDWFEGRPLERACKRGYYAIVEVSLWKYELPW